MVFHGYLIQFDSAVESQSDMSAGVYCETLIKHIGSHVERNRSALSSKQQFDLHEIGSKALSVLRWSHRVLQAYEWRGRYSGRG